MEINVMLNELERMNTEMHSYSELIDQISSNFNTTCQELMSEIESELDEEINTAIEETTKLSEKVFLDIKRHEGFVLNAFNTYSDVEKEAFLKIQALRKLVLGPNTPVAIIQKPTVPVLPVPSPYIVLDYIPIIWPETNPVTPNKRKNNGFNPVVPGFVEKITMLFVPPREFIGAFVIIAPGAIISLINDIVPIIPGGFTDVKSKDDLQEETTENAGNGGQNFEELINEVGDAERVNYNLIKAWLASEIINYIIQEYTFINEFIKYQTLGPASGETTEKSKENKKSEETPKDEKIDGSSTDDTGNKTSTGNVHIGSAKTENEDDSNRRKYTDKNINMSDVGTAFGGASAAYGAGSYFSNSGNEDDEEKTEHWNSKKNTIEDSNANISDDLESTGNTSSQNSAYGDSDTDKTLSGVSGFESSSVGGGAVGMGGYTSSIDEDEMFVSSGDPDIIEGNINVTEGFFSSADELAEKYSGRTKSDTSAAFGYASDKSSIIYRNIVASGAENASANSSMSAGIIGAGTAGAAGAGTLGGLLFNSFGADDVENAIKCVAGAMQYVNLFDMVGKAERCSISWLGETINILAQ